MSPALPPDGQDGPSSSPGAEQQAAGPAPPAAAPLKTTAYARKTAQLLGLANELRALSVSHDVQLPSLVVCGESQGAGRGVCGKHQPLHTAAAAVAAAAAHAKAPGQSRLCDLCTALGDQGAVWGAGVAPGNQSAGKSSLVEALAGVALPRATGTCTRCPTEVRLR